MKTFKNIDGKLKVVETKDETVLLTRKEIKDRKDMLQANKVRVSAKIDECNALLAEMDSLGIIN